MKLKIKKKKKRLWKKRKLKKKKKKKKKKAMCIYPAGHIPGYESRGVIFQKGEKQDVCRFKMHKNIQK